MYLLFYLEFCHFTETAKKKIKCKLPLPTVNQSLHTAELHKGKEPKIGFCFIRQNTMVTEQ